MESEFEACHDSLHISQLAISLPESTLSLCLGASSYVSLLIFGTIFYFPIAKWASTFDRWQSQLSWHEYPNSKFHKIDLNFFAGTNWLLCSSHSRFDLWSLSIMRNVFPHLHFFHWFTFVIHGYTFPYLMIHIVTIRSGCNFTIVKHPIESCFYSEPHRWNVKQLSIPIDLFLLCTTCIQFWYIFDYMYSLILDGIALSHFYSYILFRYCLFTNEVNIIAHMPLHL